MSKDKTRSGRKKPYKTPRLTKFGGIEKLTKGAGSGPLDCGFISA